MNINDEIWRNVAQFTGYRIDGNIMSSTSLIQTDNVYADY
jgi:hypothetical protein